MPARISRSSTSAHTSQQHTKKRSRTAKRSLNAFAIAAAENPSEHKIRRTRLGEVEDGGPSKRRRASDDDDEEEEFVRKKLRNVDSDSGSDDEGNHWKVGIVEEHDDSDIDSEDAFGSSDEEKYAGWSFGASSLGSTVRKKAVKLDASEDSLDETGEEDVADLESLGSDAMDLVTMLDNYRASDDDEDGYGSKGEEQSFGTAPDAETDNDTDSEAPSDFSNSDAETHDEDKLARLQHLVAKLQPRERAARKPRKADFHESQVPTASGLLSSEKFDIKDFLTITSDPQIKKVSKEIGHLPRTSKGDSRLQPTLPKRQKDKLDRIAANEKAKQTLERWVDTVKQQRQAEHLSFPLIDPETAKPAGSRLMLSTDTGRPLNDLESAIQNILQESGLTNGRRDEEEEKIQQFEELKTNTMPIEEVQARRAELRKARDLLFREEVRAKRIKKIKSKAYRRIHRKEREKIATLERDAFAEGANAEMNDEEREAADWRRAEERMGLKHKDSKWAKQMKKSGRTMWDDDAISGVSEMARNNEELMRRIEGKNVLREDASGDELLSSSDDDRDDFDLDDDSAELQSLQMQLNHADGYGTADGTVTGLHRLKFMRDAAAMRRLQNKEAIDQVKKDLAGGGDESEEGETIDRKIFGPSKVGQKDFTRRSGSKGDFEKSDEHGSDDEAFLMNDRDALTKAGSHGNRTVNLAKGNASTTVVPARQTLKSILKPARGYKSSRDPILAAKSKAIITGAGNFDHSIELLSGEKHTKPDGDGWVTVSYDHESDAEPQVGEPGILDQMEIIRRAFAGDDVEDHFEAEKKLVVEDEDEKIVDTTLPGWGSWVGQSLTKREKRDNYSRKTSKKVDGIKPEQRKDRKLGNVIINQKRVKKNAGYLAEELPFPFKTKQEYERSIRMPLGGEWNVKGVYQENVKPRLLVKPGAIIKPMDNPLV